LKLPTPRLEFLCGKAPVVKPATPSEFRELAGELHPAMFAGNDASHDHLRKLHRFFLAGVRVARAAYAGAGESPAKARGMLAGEVTRLGYESGWLIDPEERGDAQATVLCADGLTAFANRGTTSSRDRRADAASLFRQRYEHLPKGTMGRGWVRQARELEEPWLDYGADAARRKDRVVVLGHSLGGALVLPQLLVFRDAKIPVDQAITFEAPRVLNGRAAAWWQSDDGVKVPLWRVVHAPSFGRGRSVTRDIVPRLPPSGLGHRHQGLPCMVMETLTLFGRAAWQAYRRENPVSWWVKIRPITRLLRGIKAHFGAGLEETLLARCIRYGDQAPGPGGGEAP
jgi:hypothetical protein